MKAKKTARYKCNEDAKKRKEYWKKDEIASSAPIIKINPPEPVSAEQLAAQQEAETREFLAYLENDITVMKEEDQPGSREARRGLVQTVNLEIGMPTADEAVSRMNLGFMDMRAAHVRVVRLIHGYGSTGRGGKIRTAVRKELELLKTRRKIRAYVIGEDFGPYSAESRSLVDQFPEIARDQDYGKCNHGITIVVL